MPNPDLKNFQLAGLTFTLVYKLPFPVGSVDPSYATFVSSAAVEGTENAVGRIEFVVLDSPPPSPGEVLFSTPGWRLSKRAGDYTLVFTAPGVSDPLWVARISDEYRFMEVSCNPNIPAPRERGALVYRNPFGYPLDQIYLMLACSVWNGFVVHSAGASSGGRGILFAGKSGAGKSTISRLLHSRGGMSLFSDDRMAIRKVDGRYLCFGTPWPGDAGIALNGGSPLERIFFLSKSPTNRIEDIGAREAFERMLPVVSIPWYDPPVMNRVLALLEELVNKVPASVFHFTPGQEAVEALG